MQKSLEQIKYQKADYQIIYYLAGARGKQVLRCHLAKLN
jgi:hypothetical protein